ncbi:hypothetical protein TIFTF001_008493 [Ficus carica]|uniref:Uncharacterized protein n=1 Tax=Ficus carica TaxID=3494 RepID=A0AA88D2W5_FICCA|nr:hypothetical protein TIFTF001_008493 [Ficus carica]
MSRTGDFNNPETCPPTEYSRIFEEKCPLAYSYAYDDKNSTFTCSGGPPSALDQMLMLNVVVMRKLLHMFTIKGL